MRSVWGALALLATPGPTNTLLATSGAVSGFRNHSRRSPHSLQAGGGTVLSVFVCIFLLYLAWTLWRHGDVPRPEARPVTVQGVFVTTLLNPKALIFAFMLLPSDSSLTWAGVVPWLGVLSHLIVTVGACWIAIGASLRRATPRSCHCLAVAPAPSLSSCLRASSAGVPSESLEE